MGRTSTRLLILFLGAIVAAGWSTALSGRVAAAAVEIRLVPSAGPPTSVISVAGRGYLSGEAVAIAFDQDPVGTVTAGSQGRFVKEITVPSTALPGPHAVRARGTSSTMTARAVFTVRTDWPTFRFSVDRVGVNPYENVLDPSTVGRLRLDWVRPLDGAVSSSPAVVEGSAYVGSEQSEALGEGAFNAMDAETGAPRWRVPVLLGAFASPAVTDDVVYATSNVDEVYALDAASGEVLWTRGLLLAGYASPAVANGLVYIGGARLFALDATTGATEWTASIGSQANSSSPALAGGRVYVGTNAAQVYAMDAATGQQVWVSQKLGDSIGFSSPAIAEGRLYIGTEDSPPHHVRALDQATGEILWTATVGGDVNSSPAVADGTVYVGSDDGNLYAFDAATGSTKWTAPVAGCYSSPTVANGVLYIGSAMDVGFEREGRLWALHAQSGDVLWSYDVGDYVCSSPTVADGRVYVGTWAQGGSLYALGIP